VISDRFMKRTLEMYCKSILLDATFFSSVEFYCSSSFEYLFLVGRITIQSIGGFLLVCFTYKIWFRRFDNYTNHNFAACKMLFN
jgi:hypothetical protein